MEDALIVTDNAVDRFSIDREKTAPFLIRMFIKIGGFHRLTQFEDGPLPTADEQQIFTWRDATLREVLTTLRATAPATTEYRHPLARYAFKALFADPTARGRFASKDLGTVYSRDILGEPGSLTAPAPRLLVDDEPAGADSTLETLRFVPGDYMCVNVTLPKNAGPTGDLAIKGTAAIGVGNGWKRGESGWGAGTGTGAGALGALPAPRGGAHWRGESNAPVPAGARGPGRGARVDDAVLDRRNGPGGGRRGLPPAAGGRERPRDRDRDLDRPRIDRDRESPPHRAIGGRRGGRGRSPSWSRSRSRSPPPRRRR